MTDCGCRLVLDDLGRKGELGGVEQPCEVDRKAGTWDEMRQGGIR